MDRIRGRLERGVVGRSAVIGAFASLADLGALGAAVASGVDPLVANVPALLLGLVIQFVGNKWFAFRDASPRVGRQLALFSVVEVVALILSAAIFHVAVAGLGAPALLARVAASALVYFGFSLQMWRHIFTPRGPVGSCR